MLWTKVACFFFLKANKQAKNSTVLSFDQVLILCFIFYVEVTQSSAKHSEREYTRNRAKGARNCLPLSNTVCPAGSNYLFDVVYVVFVSVNGFHG